MKIVVAFFVFFFALVCALYVRAEEPQHFEVVDFSKLMPLLPEAPAGWTADKPDGSTVDAGGFKITNVHRDYKKGTADNAPTTSISILDSSAKQAYVVAKSAARK